MLCAYLLKNSLAKLSWQMSVSASTLQSIHRWDLQKAAHRAQHHPHKSYEKAFPQAICKATEGACRCESAYDMHVSVSVVPRKSFVLSNCTQKEVESLSE